MRVTPMVGRMFGQLTVLAREGSARKRLKKYAAWRCRCACGQEAVVVGQHLRRGVRTTCRLKGHNDVCRPDTALASKYPSEHRAWRNMQNRCHDPKFKNYDLYGGRGIQVCAEWKASFKAFFEHMGPKPTPAHSLDRYPDNNGWYKPGNCRWATATEQTRNMRSNVYVTYRGERVLLVSIIPSGLKGSHVYNRLRNGWPLELALATPVKHRSRKPPSLKVTKHSRTPFPLPDISIEEAEKMWGSAFRSRSE